MFFRRSTRQPAPQQVQGEQAVSASTSMPALELESVSVFTELPEGGHRRILKDVSLRFTAKRTAVLGLNGSGKSTLLGLFNGLTHPDEGIVRVNGVDTLEAPSRSSKGAGARGNSQGAFEGVGMLFAQPEAQLIMPTVAEDIDLSLRRAAAVEGSALSDDQRRERIRELLRERGLERLEDQSVFTLSGGEKQLVALTSVLAARPQILLLDEPTTLLDLRNRARLLKHLESLDQMLVLSTHDLDLAASCDEAVIIHDGRLLAQGDAAQLVQQYRTWCAEGFPNEGATEGLDSSGGVHGR
ncbi:energy-coupling factor ABC transporter ATP-binding protein [Rothia mucilaginosa]|uniref:energy-coupling factor ABC transporter ATP-binding protein n=1 Tax=Rothia mucilaginosa TaxID=43675 RepID=UPI001C59CE21|nr:ABC transporter ATP-binding protein [Rothia mucilaginosa]QXW98552.1 energy-coupling factor ABC transporter ATP-binding protein [Rothia mucilaginosa]